MRSLLFLLALSTYALEWKDLGDGRIQLTEAGKPYLVYNAGPQLKPGAPEDRRRCCYIFPVHTPAGVSMLDDFPKDHYHHRGLFWGWPEVETSAGKSDIWMIKGIEPRFVRRLQMAGPTLEVENGWFIGDKRLVRETVRIDAKPATRESRTFTVTLTLEALAEPVTLRGSHEKGKSYGGFSARFAERTHTVITSADGPVPKDEDLNPHRWAQMEAVYGGRKATLRITPDPANPGAPYQWCLRQYGFVGASFPGRTESVQSYTLQPGTPLRLKFSVTVSDTGII